LPTAATWWASRCRPRELQSGYRTLDPVSYLQVRDSDGNTLKKYEQPQAERIFSTEVAYLMQDIMSDDVARAPAFGANTALTLPDRKVAAKTGTTNGFKDNWTMGYTPQLTVGVWVGNTDNESMEQCHRSFRRGADLERGHAQVSRRAAGHLVRPPPGIVRPRSASPAGCCPPTQCQEQRAEIFVAGTEPTVSDNIWQEFDIDRETGLLAGPHDAARAHREARLPDSAARGRRLGARERSAAAAHAGSARGPEDFDPDSAIISPTVGSYIAGQLDVIGNARGGPFKLEIGAGLEPGEWTLIGSERGDEVQNGVLQRLDTRAWPKGLYTLRLTVNRGDGPRVATAR
jgi:membrane peptidoglycan carboxypeptidase